MCNLPAKTTEGQKVMGGVATCFIGNQLEIVTFTY